MSQQPASKARALDKNYVLLLFFAGLAFSAYHFPYLLRGDEPREHSRQLLMLCFLAVAARPWCEAIEFRLVFLVLSAIGCGVWASWDCLGIFTFAGFVSAMSRSRLPTWLRLLAVAVAWFAPIVAKLWLERQQVLQHIPFFVYWAGIPFSAVYLIVERARGSLTDASWADDALYLLALPRIISPFFQAIPASAFLRSQATAAVDSRLALRGAGLVLYGAALYVLMAKFPYIPPAHADVQPNAQFAGTLRGPHNLVFVYAANASAIFCAVGFFRLLGFDLASGFRQPFLANSFADFYRRWNHYVYDSIKSLFLFPLIGRLRLVLPDKAAAVLAMYLAILFGSFGLSQVLVPLALDPNPRMVLAIAFQPQELAVLGLFWSLIILPQLLPRRQQPRQTMLVGLSRRLVFVVLMFALANLASRLGVILI